MTEPNTLPTRVPSMNFRGNKFVNEDGTLTAVAQGFFDLLNAYLVTNVGDEGLVAPSQTTSGLDIIRQAQSIRPTGQGSFTCQFGTIAYDASVNKLKVALDAGYPNPPIFKEIITA